MVDRSVSASRDGIKFNLSQRNRSRGATFLSSSSPFVWKELQRAGGNARRSRAGMNYSEERRASGIKPIPRVKRSTRIHPIRSSLYARAFFRAFCLFYSTFRARSARWKSQ